MNSNIGLKFYKDYFNGLSFNNQGVAVIDEGFNNQELFEIKLINNNTLVKAECKTIELTTLYPGLLIGSGYAHEIGGYENELKLGFFFDHTTGLPCIPGSSVKGVLRDAAEKANGHYLQYLISELADGSRKSQVQDDAKKFDVALLEFKPTDNKDKIGNIIYEKSAFVKSVFDGENLPIYQRDIFFDAFPIASGNEDGKFLSNDYITHHEHPLKNPNPVQFLKVLPQVTFRFEFLLKDRPDEMPVALKLELFRQILLDLGVGAKTNVGYGKFTEKSVSPSNSDRLQDSTSGNNPNSNHSPKNKFFLKKKSQTKQKMH